MLVFDRKKGTLSTTAGAVISRTTWAGFGAAANDPARERDQMVGPLPAGIYKMGKPYQHPKLGRFVMNLDPLPGTNTFGRSLFRFHGDNTTPAPRDASHGCVIDSYAVRERADREADRLLKVI